MRLLRTIGGVDFTRQERATLNKLTMPFYQLLTYTGDVDLNEKLVEWENFYNYQRPHGAFQGKTLYETLREKESSPFLVETLRGS